MRPPKIIFMQHQQTTARQEAEGFYRPFLWLMNFIFLLLRLLFSSWRKHGDGSFVTTGWWFVQRVQRILPQGWAEWIVWIVLITIQYYCYIGILDDAVLSGSNSNNKKLVGGKFLDGLAVALLIQYIGGLFWTPMYWLSLIFPVWGAYSMYTTMLPSNTNKSNLNLNIRGSTQGTTTATKKAGGPAKKMIR